MLRFSPPPPLCGSSVLRIASPPPFVLSTLTHPPSPPEHAAPGHPSALHAGGAPRGLPNQPPHVWHVAVSVDFRHATHPSALHLSSPLYVRPDAAHPSPGREPTTPCTRVPSSGSINNEGDKKAPFPRNPEKNTFRHLLPTRKLLTLPMGRLRALRPPQLAILVAAQDVHVAQA